MTPAQTIRHHVLAIADACKGTISTGDLAESGKLQPAKGPSTGKKKKADEAPEETNTYMAEKGEASPALFAVIVKAEKRLVTGLVLQPEEVDGQGDIISSEVIQNAAHDWLARFGRATKLGLQHSSFKKNENRFTLAESWIAPMEFALGKNLIKQGAWLITVKVLADDLWEAVKAGEITGFSIGGRATAEELAKDEDAA